MGLFTNKFVAHFEAILQHFVMQCSGITMQYGNETAEQAQARTKVQLVAAARAVKRAGKSAKVLPALQQLNVKFSGDKDWDALHPQMLEALQ